MAKTYVGTDLSEDEYAALNEVAKKEDRSRASVIRLALRKFCESQGIEYPDE